MEPILRKTAGGIVIGNGGQIVIVHNPESGSWTFPKGGIEEGETDEQAARREISEEAGLTHLVRIDDLGSFERIGVRKGIPERKHIHLFLFYTNETELTPTLEIGEARWVAPKDVPGTLTIDTDRVFYRSIEKQLHKALAQTDSWDNTQKPRLFSIPFHLPLGAMVDSRKMASSTFCLNTLFSPR